MDGKLLSVGETIKITLFPKILVSLVTFLLTRSKERVYISEYQIDDRSVCYADMNIVWGIDTTRECANFSIYYTCKITESPLTLPNFTQLLREYIYHFRTTKECMVESVKLFVFCCASHYSLESTVCGDWQDDMGVSWYI